jgi:hypothetical protein
MIVGCVSGFTHLVFGKWAIWSMWLILWTIWSNWHRITNDIWLLGVCFLVLDLSGGRIDDVSRLINDLWGTGNPLLSPIWLTFDRWVHAGHYSPKYTCIPYFEQYVWDMLSSFSNIKIFDNQIDHVMTVNKLPNTYLYTHSWVKVKATLKQFYS